MPVLEDLRHPLTSIRVRIRTGDVRFAARTTTSTCASATRCASPSTSASTTTLSAATTTSTASRSTAPSRTAHHRQDRLLQIEKSRDGAAGAAAGRGVDLVNDRLVYSDDRIDRGWRRAGASSACAASPPSLRPGRPRRCSCSSGSRTRPSARHDDNDITPSTAARTRPRIRPGGAAAHGDAAGGSTFGGRLGDGERGRRAWKLQTFFPSVATIAPSLNTGLLPELRITAFDRNGFTVTNSGPGWRGRSSSRRSTGAAPPSPAWRRAPRSPTRCRRPAAAGRSTRRPPTPPASPPSRTGQQRPAGRPGHRLSGGLRNLSVTVWAPRISPHDRARRPRSLRRPRRPQPPPARRARSQGSRWVGGAPPPPCRSAGPPSQVNCSAAAACAPRRRGGRLHAAHTPPGVRRGRARRGTPCTRCGKTSCDERESTSHEG